MVAEAGSDLRALTGRVRRHIVEMVYGAQSGHIGGSMSSTDILAVLYGRVLRHDPARPDWPDRDRFIMSKGHCTPVQYATLAEFGYIPVEELATFRKQGCVATKDRPGSWDCYYNLSYAAAPGKAQGRFNGKGRFQRADNNWRYQELSAMPDDRPLLPEGR